MRPQTFVLCPARLLLCPAEGTVLLGLLQLALNHIAIAITVAANSTSYALH